MEILNKVKAWAGGLAEVGLSLAALAIILEILGLRNMPFMPANMSVVDNVTNMVSAIGSQGVIGLIAVWDAITPAYLWCRAGLDPLLRHFAQVFAAARRPRQETDRKVHLQGFEHTAFRSSRRSQISFPCHQFPLGTEPRWPAASLQNCLQRRCAKRPRLTSCLHT